MKKFFFNIALAAMLLGFASCSELDNSELSMEAMDNKATNVTIIGFVKYDALNSDKKNQNKFIEDGSVVYIDINMEDTYGGKKGTWTRHAVSIKENTFKVTFPCPPGKTFTAKLLAEVQASSYKQPYVNEEGVWKAEGDFSSATTIFNGTHDFSVEAGQTYVAHLNLDDQGAIDVKVNRDPALY